MHRFLKSITSIMTIGGMALVILAIVMQVSGQTGQVASASGNKTPSSVNKSGNAMPQHSKDVRCDPDDPAAAGRKSQAALAGIAQPHRVDLTWKASSTPGVQYRVYRCIPGGPCVYGCEPASPCSIALVSGTSHSDTNVQVDQRYCYFVTAVTAPATNKERESKPSNVARVLIPSPETPSLPNPSK